MDILMSVSHNSQARESAMKQFYQYCVAQEPKLKIKVNKIHHFLKIYMMEVYFLTEDEYEIWCKGRTYIYHGVPYHSGYPIKKENSEKACIPSAKQT